MNVEIHSSSCWPLLRSPERDRLGRYCPVFACYAADFSRSSVRHGNAIENMRELFEEACFVFECIHGERAANDFRRAAFPGGKESGKGNRPCVAPSEVNARIGANAL